MLIKINVTPAHKHNPYPLQNGNESPMNTLYPKWLAFDNCRNVEWSGTPIGVQSFQEFSDICYSHNVFDGKPSEPQDEYHQNLCEGMAETLARGETFYFNYVNFIRDDQRYSIVFDQGAFICDDHGKTIQRLSI